MKNDIGNRETFKNSLCRCVGKDHLPPNIRHSSRSTDPNIQENALCGRYCSTYGLWGESFFKNIFVTKYSYRLESTLWPWETPLGSSSQWRHQCKHGEEHHNDPRRIVCVLCCLTPHTRPNLSSSHQPQSRSPTRPRLSRSRRCRCRGGYLPPSHAPTSPPVSRASQCVDTDISLIHTHEPRRWHEKEFFMKRYVV